MGYSLFAIRDSLFFGHVFVEPLEDAVVAVLDVGRVAEAVAFVGVDDELGFDAQIAESVPELEALRGRTLAVAVADDDECRSGDVFDEADGGGFGIDGGIVVDAGTEERDHPLIDGVFAVVAEPVGDAGAGDSGTETMGLRDIEHGHEAAVAPAGEAFAVLVEGRWWRMGRRGRRR